MKTLRESLLSQDIDANDDIMLKGEILRALYEWEILRKGSVITEDNIDFDSKKRIIFKDISGVLEFNLNNWGWPEIIEKHGFGSIPNSIQIRNYGSGSGITNLSDLRLEGKYPFISIWNSHIHLDAFPQAKEIHFVECFFQNTHIKAKKKPKNTKIVFNEGSYMNYARDAMKYAMGYYVDYAYQKLTIET